MFGKYNPFSNILIGIIKAFSTKIYKCPRCNYQINQKMKACRNCKQPIRWGGIS